MAGGKKHLHSSQIELSCYKKLLFAPMFLAWPIHLGIGCTCKSKLMELALTSMKKIRGQGVLQKEKSFLNQCNILFIVKEPADLHVIAGYMTDLQLLYIGTAL